MQKNRVCEVRSLDRTQKKLITRTRTRYLCSARMQKELGKRAIVPRVRKNTKETSLSRSRCKRIQKKLFTATLIQKKLHYRDIVYKRIQKKHFTATSKITWQSMGNKTKLLFLIIWSEMVPWN